MKFKIIMPLVVLCFGFLSPYLGNFTYMINDCYSIDCAEYDIQEKLNDLVEVDKILDNFYSAEPIEVDWKVLTDIKYKLRYNSEIDMEIYTPIFSKAVKVFHEKTVIIKGFVIPFDEEEELLTLSANPYSSCFFCGNASPASIISLYLKNNRKRYKIDDFKKFKGKLYLNSDDPNEFYYILRNAEEQ